MAKNKPLKKQSATLLDNKTQTAMWEKRERTLSPAEISWGADNLGEEVRKN